MNFAEPKSNTHPSVHDVVVRLQELHVVAIVELCHHIHVRKQSVGTGSG